MNENAAFLCYRSLDHESISSLVITNKTFKVATDKNTCLQLSIIDLFNEEKKMKMKKPVYQI